MAAGRRQQCWPKKARSDCPRQILAVASQVLRMREKGEVCNASAQMLHKSLSVLLKLLFKHSELKGDGSKK